MNGKTLSPRLAQSREFIDGCLNTWEQGGKDQVYNAISDGLVSLSQPLESSHDQISSLVYALLGRHTWQLRLQSSSLCNLFQQLISSSLVKEEPRASSSRYPSPTNSNSEHASSSPLADILLDVIWAIDLEIEARKEIAVTAKASSLVSSNDGTVAEGTLDEQAKTAKTRLSNVVRELLSQGVLSSRTVSERLEVSLLASIGLVDDETAFSRRVIRLNTATLYKQQKFNLLREENEGYSGLMNEVVGGMGPSTRAVRGPAKEVRLVEQESADERNARARRVMMNVSALIGYFDLDPNRVLDIILDIFSTNVVLHWPFFLALLAASPWRKGTGKTSAAQQSSMKDAMNVDPSNKDAFGSININVKEDSGHDIVAQLMGFKFGFYQQQDVSEKVPEELYLTAAILIREGHVRFIDLYNHLSPDEKEMAALHEKYKQSMSDKVMSAKGNALSMAAPLTEEGGGLSRSDANGKGENGGGSGDLRHDPPNQILGLLKALLGIGHLRCALFILARYPWLCGAYPQVADLYSRLLYIVVEPAYSTVSLNTQVPVASNPSLKAAKLRYDNKRQELLEVPLPTLRITSVAPEPLPTMTNRFIYFYSPWKQSLPLLNVDQLLSEFVPLLRVLGSHLHRNQVLFQQICRLARVAMRASSIESSEYSAWLEVVRNILLPALTMTSGNSGLVSEVWVILRQLPYTVRYNLYGEWKYALYRRPELRARQAETEKEAKGILKRISSDNVKLSGRSLAKSSHTNPTIFFTVALNQVQSYSNLIAPIVESAKYLTHFEYDVFGFNLIDALSNPEKERTKQDGTSVSMWLQSLAAFTGTLYKRYAMMDCSPVLQYIANQLKENNSKDLVIVRELILKMAGIEPLANLSDTQVAALTGGRQLRMEAMMVANANVATPARVQLKKSGARLLHALTESRMAIPLLILIAQQRQASIHLVESGEAHLKYLGNLFDSCQEILFQYVEFLHNQLEPQAYADLVPTINDLCTRFVIEPAIAFHIARPRLDLKLRVVEAKETEERLRKEVLASKMQSLAKGSTFTEEEPKQEDVEMKNAESEKGVEETSGTTDVEMTTVPEQEATDTLVKAEQPAVKQSSNGSSVEVKAIWKAGLDEAILAAENILPDEAKMVIGVHYYATFWQLSLADIAVPTERYEQELRSLQQIVDQNPEGGRKSIHKARIQALETQGQLRAELREQTLSHSATRRRLQIEKDHWFTDNPGRSDIVHQLMQHCFVPRALLSPTDAIFAGRFLRSMHVAGTRNFSSLTAYDKIIIEQVAPLVFSCTENEIRNYARFLQIILTDLNLWFKDQERYTKEAYGDNLPGFQMKWANRHGGEAIPRSDLLSYEKFVAVMNKWHSMLRSLFRECLTSKEYMRIRNTIVIMTRISNQFPLWEAHGIDLLDSITIMTQEEDRGDLKILGQGLLATLKKQQKTWIGVKKKIVPVEAAPTATSSTEKPTQADDKDKETSVKAPPTGPAASAVDKSTAAVVKGVNGDKVVTTREIGETTPPREPSESRRSSENRNAISSTAVLRTTSNAPSPSISAARKAALESMKNTGMDPPRTAASTMSAQASRDRQSSTSQRDREVSASTSRGRERESEVTKAQSSSKSLASSREASPGVSSSSAKGSNANEAHDTRKTSRGESRTGSRAGSRAGSEEAASKSSRSDRERDRQSSSQRDREISTSTSRVREPEASRDRKPSSQRDRETSTSTSRVREREPEVISQVSSRRDEARRVNEEEPNKRARLNRNRFAEEDQPRRGESSVKVAEEVPANVKEQSSSIATSASQGISIQGQGRTTSSPQYHRRDSHNQSHSRGGNNGAYDSGRGNEYQRSSSNNASRSGSASHRGTDRGGGEGKEREQRRRDRRSGHD